MNKKTAWNVAAKVSHALAAVSLGSALALTLVTSTAHGQINVDITGQLKNTASPAFQTGSSKGLPEIVGQYIAVFLGFLGMIALVLVIYAGYLWMTAAGSEDKVEKAKEILKNAVIGLIIITLAYAISNFIITSILNAAKK